MKKQTLDITKLIEKKDVYPDGANWPTRVEVYECFCGNGTIEYCRVPGFDDEYTTIECPKCKKKYSYIEKGYKCFYVYEK